MTANGLVIERVKNLIWRSLTVKILWRDHGRQL